MVSETIWYAWSDRSTNRYHRWSEGKEWPQPSWRPRRLHVAAHEVQRRFGRRALHRPSGDPRDTDSVSGLLQGSAVMVL